jgi:hypothetical protein
LRTPLDVSTLRRVLMVPVLLYWLLVRFPRIFVISTVS